MKKKYILVGLLCLLTLLLIFSFKHYRKSNHKTKSEAGNILVLNSADVARSRVEDFEQVIAVTGDLQPRSQTIISSEITAKVLQVLVDEGQSVVSGQVLARLDQDNIKQNLFAQLASVKQAQDNLNLQQRMLQQQKELFKENFISAIAYAQYQNNYDNAKQNFYAQKALLTQAETNLSYTVIKAPFDGVILKKSIEAGGLAMPNTNMFVVADLKHIIIQSAVVSDNISKVNIGQKVSFTVENDSKKYEGYVERIGQSMEDGTRDFAVYINFDNSKYHLKGGQFIRGNIIVNTIKNAVVIPCTAIDKNHNIFLIDTDSGKLTSKPVVTKSVDTLNGQCVLSTQLADNSLLVNGNLDHININNTVQIL